MDGQGSEPGDGVQPPARRLSRRAFVRLTVGSALATTAVGAGGLAYSSQVEPRWLDIARQTLILPRLAPAFAGYRLVHLSDIHLDPWMTPARFLDIVATTNALDPDLIAITGDFVTTAAARYAAPLAAALRGLRARDGIFATLGNHDHWSGAAKVREALVGGNVQELNNDLHVVRRGADALYVGGIDDHWEGKSRLDLVLDRLRSAGGQGGGTILLAHEPDFADTSAATGRFDLQLSGHSHGGQITVPGIGPLILPPLGRKYPQGRYQVGEMIQYTSRGLGMVRPYVRLGCRPEIVLFTLLPQGA